MESIEISIVFLFGTLIGSFLNVCIYRIPEGLSVVRPASRCPECFEPIRWYQNIPILSWLVLRGKCGQCGASISIRYAAVEMLTGLLFVMVVTVFGFSFVSFIYAVFIASMVVITFIDIDHQIIPDAISLPGIIVGFIFSFFNPSLAWSDSIFGILLGGGSLYVVAFIYELLTKKEGMGGGDIKLLAMIGAFLGWKSILPIIFISSLLGTIVGIPLMLFKGETSKFAIPFGPFLALAAVVYLFFGEAIVQWYWASMSG